MKSPHYPLLQGRGKTLWHAVCRWFHINTHAPGWMPERLRHPLVSYLLVVPLMCMTIAFDMLLLRIFPGFEFVDLPITLVVLVVALTWGAGTGLFAILLGAFLLYYVIFPPRFAILWKDLVTMVQNTGVIIGGLMITLIVSQREQQRQAAERRAREEAEMRQKMDSFLMIASHELKTPLTTIRLHLQLTQRRLQRVMEAGETNAVRLQQALEVLGVQIAATLRQWVRLDRLVNDFLEMSHIQTDSLELCMQPVDLKALIEAIVEEQRQTEPNSTISLMLPPDSRIVVTADPYRLEQVLLNYLANALKYSPETAAVTVGARMEERQVRIWFRDEGPGLPVAEHKRIWERFYRAPGIEIQNGSGVGLGIGLYVCRNIIEGYRGQVGVDSTPGEGSTFWFTLPLAPEAQEVSA